MRIRAKLVNANDIRTGKQVVGTPHNKHIGEVVFIYCYPTPAWTLPYGSPNDLEKIVVTSRILKVKEEKKRLFVYTFHTVLEFEILEEQDE